MQSNDKLYNKIVGYDTRTGERIVRVEFNVKKALERSSSPNTWAHEVVKSMFKEESENPSDLQQIATNVIDEVSTNNNPKLTERIPSNEQRYKKRRVPKRKNFSNIRDRTKSIPIRRVKKENVPNNEGFKGIFNQ